MNTFHNQTHLTLLHGYLKERCTQCPPHPQPQDLRPHPPHLLHLNQQEQPQGCLAEVQHMYQTAQMPLSIAEAPDVF
ncbi:hypothetical protein ILYODFUR_026702 [Ilyodon furcidens]|uniref:Uncharacterized protein n=1 Tax=Ilyodon furcidens TaxID=33524 RepID=A0ABV0UVG2_9TELE